MQNFTSSTVIPALTPSVWELQECFLHLNLCSVVKWTKRIMGSLLMGEKNQFWSKHYIWREKPFLRSDLHTSLYNLIDSVDHLKRICPALEAFFRRSDWLRPRGWKRLQKCKTCCWLLWTRWSHTAPSGRAECECICESLPSALRPHQTRLGKRRDAHVRNETHWKDLKRGASLQGAGPAAGWRMLSSRSVVVECG